MEAEGFDDEVVVFALRKAGDGDAADDAGSSDVEGKTTAMGGVVGFGEAVSFGKGEFVLLEIEADVVRAAVETGDYVGFSLDPAGIVGGCAGEGGVEEGLVRLAGTADVDHNGVIAGKSKFTEGEAEGPGGVVVETGEAKFGFLADDGGDIFCYGHGFPLLTFDAGSYEAVRSIWTGSLRRKGSESVDCGAFF